MNSKPLTGKQLKGKVVLVDFWTYSCINCLRALPYIPRVDRQKSEMTRTVRDWCALARV